MGRFKSYSPSAGLTFQKQAWKGFDYGRPVPSKPKPPPEVKSARRKQQKLEKAARRDAGYLGPSSRLLKVANRDEWTCHLCDRPVPREFEPTSPWAPSLDHIVPRLKGGTYDAANVKLAHRTCNNRRGAKPLEKCSPEMFAKVPISKVVYAD